MIRIKINIIIFIDKYKIYPLDEIKTIKPEVIILTVDRVNAILPFVESYLMDNNIQAKVISDLFNQNDDTYKFLKIEKSYN